jgi:hypothetical protein
MGTAFIYGVQHKTGEIYNPYKVINAPIGAKVRNVLDNSKYFRTFLQK